MVFHGCSLSSEKDWEEIGGLRNTWGDLESDMVRLASHAFHSAFNQSVRWRWREELSQPVHSGNVHTSNPHRMYKVTNLGRHSIDKDILLVRNWSTWGKPRSNVTGFRRLWTTSCHALTRVVKYFKFCQLYWYLSDMHIHCLWICLRIYVHPHLHRNLRGALWFGFQPN